MSGLTGANSPFAAMSKGVSLSQSIAFTVVYALMGAALILRTVRGVTHKVAYICFTIFAVCECSVVREESGWETGWQRVRWWARGRL